MSSEQKNFRHTKSKSHKNPQQKKIEPEDVDTEKNLNDNFSNALKSKTALKREQETAIEKV